MHHELVFVIIFQTNLWDSNYHMMMRYKYVFDELIIPNVRNSI